MADDPFAEFGGTTISGENLSPEEQARRDYEEAIGSGTLSVSAVRPGSQPPPEGDPFGAFGGKEIKASGGIQPSDALPQTQPETTIGGVTAAAVRGAAPTVAGAGAGAVLGGLAGGILTGGPGVLPGAIMGARIGGAVAPLVSDLGVGAINSIFKTHYTQPTEALNHFLTSIGVPNADTEAERIVQAASGAVTGTAASMGLGTVMSGAGNAVVRRIGQFLSANPEQQLASATTGAVAGQEVQEMGGGTGAQIAANVLAGMGTVKLMGSTLVNTAENAARQQLVREGREAGIRVATSDAFPSQPGFLRRSAEGFPLLGTKGMNERTVRQRARAVADLLSDYGVTPSLVERDVGLTRLYASFVTRRQQQLTAASTLKRQAMATAAATNLPMPTTNAIAAIDNQLAALAGSINENEIAPILRRFRTAILGSNLDAVENARREVGRQFTSRGMEHIRTRGEQILNSIYAPLRNDIRDFINTHGAPGDVRRWEVANRQIRVLANDLDEATLRNVLATGDRTPENIQQLIFNAPSSKIASTYRSLSPLGQAQFRTAIIREAAQSSLVNGVVNPRQLASNIRALERQLRIGFSPDQRQAVEGLGRVLEATQSAERQISRMPAMVSGTTIAAVSHFLHAGFVAQLSAAVGITGTAAFLARIYESRYVRETLIQLARVQPGTVGYEGAMRSAIEAINTEITKETKTQEKKK